MNIEEKDFIPLLLGNDINTYSMARAFYEEYRIKSVVIGKYPTGPSCHSKIIEYQAEMNLDDPEVFIQTINSWAARYASKKVILLGCGDNYVELIIKNRELLRDNIIAPYIEERLMQALITKEQFYQICDKHQLEYPQTFIYEAGMNEELTLPFDFPVILKPSDGVLYWKSEFPGQKKVYKLDNCPDLKRVIGEIYQAGYNDKLIIQDYIPGDDEYIRVMNCFSGQDKKVKLMAMGHVMLEEHTPHGLGNATVILSDYDEELSGKIKEFLEDIEFEGFCNFDIKYDQRDGKLKIFEINLRQGRSSYYVTGAGYNLAKYVTEEYIFNRPIQYEIVNTEHLFIVVPTAVIYSYVRDKANIDKIKQLIREKKFVNPLFLKGDYGLPRLIYLVKSQLSHFIKYRKYYK